MALAFSDLWEEEQGPFARARLFFRAFGRLPWVAFLEWKDQLKGAPSQGLGKRQWRWGMSAWLRNLKYAFRTLRKSPSFGLTTVELIGLGVGSVTTIFTLVDHVLLRPLPYPEADRLFLVENGSHSGPTVRIQQTEVSRDFFSLFGARPAVGRLLVDEDFQAANVAVLSHGLWERVFGGDDSVVGRTIRVDDAPYTVVGVLSSEFVQPEAVFHGDETADVWLPMDWSRDALEGVGYHALEVAGRVAPGATVADVEIEIGRALDRLAQLYPDQFLDEDGNLGYSLPPAGLQEITTRPVRAGLNLLLGAVALLLLVAALTSWLPARRAGRTDPLETLKAE